VQSILALIFPEEGVKAHTHTIIPETMFGIYLALACLGEEVRVYWRY
jgi:hypothetical protein